MELTPLAITHERKRLRRQKRLLRILAGVLFLYLLLVAYEIFTAATIHITNGHLREELASITPAVMEMQNTARLLDAMRPTMEPSLFPLEILRHVMDALPETGVRLTRFEILQGKLEIAGESATAREAFAFLSKVQELEPEGLIEWEEPPPPVPLPNNTTRFSLRGTITEAYKNPDDT